MMTDDLKNQLKNHFWSGAYADAETLLVGILDGIDTPLADVCRATTLERLTVTGWDEVTACVGRRGAGYTAIGIDISNHGDLTPTPEGWSGPDIDVNYYSDTYFPFSTSSRDDIIAAIQTGSTPWQGCFEDIDHPLVIKGLEHLNTMMESHKWGDPCADKSLYETAEWFRLLRFHQVMLRYLDRLPAIMRLPVLIGSNEVAPFMESVRMPSPAGVGQIAEPQTESKAPGQQDSGYVSAVELRKRLNQTPQTAGIEKPAGFFQKLFGRT